jgi:hypothetical protein
MYVKLIQLFIHSITSLKILVFFKQYLLFFKKLWYTQTKKLVEKLSRWGKNQQIDVGNWVNYFNSQSVPKDLFQNQVNLVKLNLYMNNIKALSNNSFGHQVVLNTFFISYNKIQKIDASIFTNFPNLERFDSRKSV